MIHPWSNILVYVHKDIAVWLMGDQTVHEEGNNMTHFKYNYKFS